MASSFEKSVKGATKIKLAAPKSKYIEHILIATHTGEAGVAEVFRALQNRLRDSTWTIVFKSLITIHMMIREGEPDVTLRFLSTSPNRKLAINHFTEVQTQGRNIRAYAEYLYQRAVCFGQTNFDYVRGGQGRLKRLSVDKGILRETESVQDQIRALLKCEFLSHEPENEITLTGFRLLTMDLLVLFHVMNEGTINVLEHYFEMSKTDAERALNIYRVFVKQTDQVVQYLGLARHYEHATRLEIPKIKHAPTSLAASLEEYLNDKDFEINRRQYLAQQEAKKGAKSANGIAKSTTEAKSVTAKVNAGQSFPSVKEPAQPVPPPKPESKGPAPDLIDFFESIEQNQQPMAQPQNTAQYQPQQQLHQQMPQQLPPQAMQPAQTGFIQQTMPFQQQQQPLYDPTNPSGNPFGLAQQPQSIQMTPTGAPVAALPPYNLQQTAPSPLSQTGQSPFQPQLQQQLTTGTPAQMQPQSTNPFRQSVVPNFTGISNAPFSSSVNAPLSNRASTNPFAKPITPQSTTGSTPTFMQNPSVQLSQPNALPAHLQPQLQPLQAAPTGTNPFARNPSPLNSQQTPPPQLAPNPTGSTNPFRQSAFVNPQTGQGWQNSQQGTLGGLEQLPTIAVFPRPGQGQQPMGQPGQQGWAG